MNRLSLIIAEIQIGYSDLDLSLGKVFIYFSAPLFSFEYRASRYKWSRFPLILNKKDNVCFFLFQASAGSLIILGPFANPFLTLWGKI